MAELNNSAGANRRQGFARAKKLSTRVDLTPMVDLGFLLITFFVFTTTATRPRVMPMHLPAGDIHDTNLGQSTVLTLLPIDKDRIFYYHGELADANKEGRYGITNYSITNGVGHVIRQKQEALEKTGKYKRSDVKVIIRPSGGSSYKNAVDILDEMVINDVKIYFLDAFSAPEKNFLASKGF
ncbi:MAG TPA: biopolymer transporter ExbD [Chitinophagaceae bacterium]|nr:biopolymer transporter ExbD [Chitinophagaceae bacterium]